jgi:hypothetical protein
MEYAVTHHGKQRSEQKKKWPLQKYGQGAQLSTEQRKADHGRSKAF